MFRTIVFLFVLCAAALAQQSGQPQVKMNYLNVCAPSAEEQRALASALELVPLKPAFAADFEVARGKTTLPDAPAPSAWVRIRREYAAGSLVNAQYTFTKDEKEITETIVFRVRDPKRDQPMQISLNDTVASSTPQQVLAGDHAPDRVRVERFGGSSVVLARCAEANQQPYLGVFAKSAQIMTAYRRMLRVRETVAADLARIK